MKNIANDLLKASIIIEQSGVEEDVIGLYVSRSGEQLQIQVLDPKSLLKISDKAVINERDDEEYPIEVYVVSEGIRFFTVENTIPKFLTEAV